MSTVASGLPRAACTIKPGMVIEHEGRLREVREVLTRYADAASPHVILRFTDGGRLRAHPGVEFAVVSDA